jgi:hypothetical protein
MNAAVAQRAGDEFHAAVVAVKSHLSQQNARPVGQITHAVALL